MVALIAIAAYVAPMHALAQNSANGRTFTIASSNNFPPVNMQSPDTGELVGFGPDLSNAVIRAIGGNSRRISSSYWLEVVEALVSGKADVVHDAAYTESRARKFGFTAPILSMPERIFVRRDRQGITDISSLKNATVACVNNHISHSYLKTIPHIRCRVTQTPAEAISNLVTGSVDAFIFPQQVAEHVIRELRQSDFIKIVGDPIRTLHWSMIVRKDDRATLDLLNKGLKQVRASGEYLTIYNKWFAPRIFAEYSDFQLRVLGLIAALCIILFLAGVILVFVNRRLRSERHALHQTVNHLNETRVKLEKSEQRHNAILNTSQDAIVTFGQNGIIATANAAAIKIFGYASDELIGMNINRLMPEPYRSRHNQILKSYFSSGQDRNRGAGRVLPAINKAEHVFPIELFFSRFIVDNEHMLAGVIRDVSGQNWIENALKKSEERFRHFAEAASDWLWETDSEHRFIFFSDRFGKIGSISPVDMIGIRRHDVIPKLDDPEKWRHHLDDLDNHRPFRNFEYSLKMTDDTNVFVRVHGRPYFSESGDFLGYRGSASNITVEREALNGADIARNLLGDSIDNLPESIALFDKDDRLTLFNKTFKHHWAGLTKIIQPGLSYSEFLKALVDHNLISDIQDDPQKWIDSTLKSHLSATQDTEYKTADGAWVLQRDRRAADGGTISSWTDITTLKENDSRLRKQAETLTDIATNDMAPGQSLDDVLKKITRKVAETLNVEQIGIWLDTEDKTEFYCNTAYLLSTDQYNPLDNFDPRKYPMHQKALANERCMAIQDVFNDPRVREFAKERMPKIGVNSLMQAPLRVFGKMIGFIGVGHVGGFRDWAEEEQNFIASVADLTAIAVESSKRSLTETALHHSEQQFQAIADHTYDWESWIDSSGRAIWINPAVERITGYNVSECMDMIDYPYAIIHEDDRSQARKSLSADTGNDVEFRIVTKDMEIVWVATSWQPISDDNRKPLGVRISTRDISERKAVETQLIQSAKLATLGEMAAGMSHELSQPLNIIRFAAEGALLKFEKNKATEDVLRKQFELIEAQSKRMAGIMDHVRAFSRKQTDEFEVFNPLHAIKGATKLVENQCIASDIALMRNLSEKCDFVNGLPIQMEQVILNLVANAQAAIMEKREQLGVENSQYHGTIDVAVNNHTTSKSIIITIEDNGCGIPEDQVDKIFEPFFTTKEVGSGTGLGLSVSFGIISSMSGTMTAENTVNGALFRITLPAIHGTEEASKDVEYPTPRPTIDRRARYTKNSRHILIVDDEPQAALAMADYLTDEGYRTSTANNGLEALEIFGETPADLVITDLRMPKLDGHQLAASLKEAHPKLPIIAVTGHVGISGDLDEDLKKSFSTILKKPVSLSALGEIVHHFARKKLAK